MDFGEASCGRCYIRWMSRVYQIDAAETYGSAALFIEFNRTVYVLNQERYVVCCSSVVGAGSRS